jgi:hypothetical protein
MMGCRSLTSWSGTRCEDARNHSPLLGAYVRLRCSQAEGDFVEKGQPLLKVETEEVSADIDSDWTG